MLSPSTNKKYKDLLEQTREAIQNRYEGEFDYYFEYVPTKLDYEKTLVNLVKQYL